MNQKKRFPWPRRHRSFSSKFGRDVEFFGCQELYEPPTVGLWPIFPIAAACGILLCAAVLFIASLWTVSEVTAEDGRYYTADQLLTYADIPVGDELMGFDASDVEDRLTDALPLLKKVHVRKHLDGSVSIKTTEYQKLYYTQHHVNYYLIDATDFHVIGVMSEPDEARRVGAVYIGLPENARVRVGETVSFINLPYEPESMPEEANTYEVETAEPNEEFGYVFTFIEHLMASPLSDRVRGMEMTDRYALIVLLEGSIRIDVGDMSELDRKFSMADRALADKAGEGNAPGGTPIQVDVSDPARIAYRVAPDIVLPSWA